MGLDLTIKFLVDGDAALYADSVTKDIRRRMGVRIDRNGQSYLTYLPLYLY